MMDGPTIVARVSALEGQCRRLRFIVLALCVVLFAVGMRPLGVRAEVLEAQRFVVVDESGAPVAALGSDLVPQDDSASALCFFGAGGDAVVSLGYSRASRDAGLLLGSSSGAAAAEIGVDGQDAFVFLTSEGKRRISMNANHGVGRLFLTTKSGGRLKLGGMSSRVQPLHDATLDGATGLFLESADTTLAGGVYATAEAKVHFVPDPAQRER